MIKYVFRKFFPFVSEEKESMNEIGQDSWGQRSQGKAMIRYIIIRSVNEIQLRSLDRLSSERPDLVNGLKEMWKKTC